MVYTLARDTGWPENFILWELPMARALQYYHCALQNANLWTLEVTTQKTLSELVPHSLTDFVAGLSVDDED